MIPLINSMFRGGGQVTVDRLRTAIFATGYPGFTPSTVEIPDGRGEADTGKRYSHVTPRLIEQAAPDDRAFLREVFDQCFDRALEEEPVGTPELEYHECCLRLIEYPPHVGSAPHSDMSLFTLNIWRSHENYVWPTTGDTHAGEMSEIFNPVAVATRHRVAPAPETQTSLVFFALPARCTATPDGGTVGEWLDARKALSRRAA